MLFVQRQATRATGALDDCTPQILSTGIIQFRPTIHSILGKIPVSDSLGFHRAMLVDVCDDSLQDGMQVFDAIDDGPRPNIGKDQVDPFVEFARGHHSEVLGEADICHDICAMIRGQIYILYWRRGYAAERAPHRSHTEKNIPKVVQWYLETVSRILRREKEREREESTYRVAISTGAEADFTSLSPSLRAHPWRSGSISRRVLSAKEWDKTLRCRECSLLSRESNTLRT